MLERDRNPVLEMAMVAQEGETTDEEAVGEGQDWGYDEAMRALNRP